MNKRTREQPRCQTREIANWGCQYLIQGFGIPKAGTTAFLSGSDNSDGLLLVIEGSSPGRIGTRVSAARYGRGWRTKYSQGSYSVSQGGKGDDRYVMLRQMPTTRARIRGLAGSRIGKSQLQPCDVLSIRGKSCAAVVLTWHVESKPTLVLSASFVRAAYWGVRDTADTRSMRG